MAFENYDDIDPAVGYQYVSSGTHELEIVSLEYKDGKVFGNFLAVQSEGGTDNTGQAVPALRIGGEYSVGLEEGGKYRESNQRKVKAFVAACLGYDPSDEATKSVVNGQAMRLAVSSAQPCRGRRVHCTAWQKLGDSPFTHCKWAPAMPPGVVSSAAPAIAAAPPPPPAAAPPTVRRPPAGWQPNGATGWYFDPTGAVPGQWHADPALSQAG